MIMALGSSFLKAIRLGAGISLGYWGSEIEL
jgi:hypothetical protein